MESVCVDRGMLGFGKKGRKGVDFGEGTWYSKRAVRLDGGGEPWNGKRRKKCLTNAGKSDRIATFRK